MNGLPNDERQRLGALLEHAKQDEVMAMIPQFSQTEIHNIVPPPAETPDRLGVLVFNMERGVHLAELSQAAAIEACAAVTLDLEHPEYQLTRCTLPARLAAPDRRDLPQGCMDWHWRDDGAFVFQLSHALPKRAWCHVLTNGRFGYLAADRGLGHMWVLNAR